ncbi:uncharacterized protein LOC122511951 [Leptopilina heterotoma]|uniref:uncharacterized protein LOC122511951 n=1 Tax=Leptopilina heterotoma TaxID=63436 RepID=UPI001CA8B028|nr:uncharacterized protein LOC122511951 [Leptopilina heterotoma]
MDGNVKIDEGDAEIVETDGQMTKKLPQVKETNAAKTKEEETKSKGKRFNFNDILSENDLENLHPYDKMLLSKVTKIEVTTDLLARRSNQTNGSNTSNLSTTYSFLHKSPELSDFPLNDMETFDKVEKKLEQDTDFFDIVVSI